MNSELLTLEEKVDKILEYQKSSRRLAMFRTAMSVIIFVVFVAIPIISAFYLADYIKNTIDFTEITETYQGIKDASGEITNLSNLLN